MSTSGQFSHTIRELIIHRDRISLMRNSLTALIDSLERDRVSSILSVNNMPNNYYRKFVERETETLNTAKLRRDGITNVVLPAIENRITTLETMSASLMPPRTGTGR